MIAPTLIEMAIPVASAAITAGGLLLVRWQNARFETAYAAAGDAALPVEEATDEPAAATHEQLATIPITETPAATYAFVNQDGLATSWRPEDLHIAGIEIESTLSFDQAVDVTEFRPFHPTLHEAAVYRGRVVTGRLGQDADVASTKGKIRGRRRKAALKSE